MSFNLTVLYPNDAQSSFDKQHYVNTHLPLVEKYWRSAGLLRWEFVGYKSMGGEKDPEYQIGTFMQWKDEASFKAATEGPGYKEVMDDVKNFSNRQPIFLVGDILKSG